MRYVQRLDGEGFSVRSGEKTRWACCDCGLVHDIAFVVEAEFVGIAAAVNRRATAARRRTPPADHGAPDHIRGEATPCRTETREEPPSPPDAPSPEGEKT